MPKFLLKRWHGLHMLWAFVFMIVLVAVLSAYQLILGIVALLISAGLAYYTIMAERAFRKDLNRYVGTLSHRVKRASHEVITELPIGILLYNEERVVEWHNPYVAKMLEKESVIGEPLHDVLPMLKNRKEKEARLDITIGKKLYQVQVKAEERLLFFQDITTQSDLYRRYQEEKIAIGIVMLDNLDEATQGMDDQTRSITLAKVAGEISEWATRHQIYLRRTSSDRFFILMDQKGLHQLEQTRFDILDEVRDSTIELKVPFTLSIGVSAGAAGLIELGSLAQSSLDMALGRGGDQAAVKVGQRLSFYGGRSNAVEKRTRVRARVIAHALRDLIRESDNVFIMGHKLPDMDSVGAAIGLKKVVEQCGKQGYVVIEGVNPSIQRLMEVVQQDEKLKKWFITPEQALQLMKPRSLAVVADTHKASLVAEPKLLQVAQRKVVVDHHRRGEEFINDAVLVYMEPYASSTCELVTELLQYVQERVALDSLEATMLLAGITMDTKSFSLRTGARTFEAASFLRRHGADSALIQRLLKEDLASFVNKSEVIKRAEILYDHVALAVTEPNRKYSQLLISQVADTLLNMTDIMASFVISERLDGQIGVSARSLGQINVQVVMERLGGGGHLTNAAAQLAGTVQEAETKLKRVLAEIQAEEGLFE
ncbi:DHH family phosphoesterase [Paenibacillus cymbidii]|uniref:DHH family phosphoesterase n=1 Tax=Paenibacillus cymbidii TaxID=1639034 RepID=UPI001081AC69|nr:DHH family phosphoesterase [Paenibacillus cymbidii]